MVSEAGRRRLAGREGFAECCEGAFRGRCGSENKPNMLLVGGNADTRFPALMMNTTTIFAAAAMSQHPAATAGASNGGGWSAVVAIG